MTKSILSLAAAALLASPFAEASAPQGVYEKLVKQYSSSRHDWAKGSQKSSTMAKTLRTEPDGELPPASSYGYLFTPDNEQWFYTSEYTYSGSGSIEKVKMTVYDASFNVYSSFDFDLELAEGDVTINHVEPVSQLTAKFFNLDQDYEMMVFVHAATTDYNGHYYTKVYSLKDGSHVADFDGNNIGMVNTPPDKWTENYTMAFMREWFDDDDNYMISFDIYGKAGWNSGAQFKHTFDINYKYVSGSGAAAFPFMMTANGNNQVMFALPSYEKPFFATDDYFMEPEVTKDNNFVIDLYDDTFNKVKRTTIPMDSVPGYIYSFPGIGILQGFGDMTFGEYNDSKDDPVYIVGYENYTSSSDDFVCDFYVYNSDGERIATIFKDATDYLWLSDIPGYDKQFCFYDADNGTFNTVDLPSCQQVSVIPITTEEGLRISTAFDRAPYGNSYLYVTSVNAADVDADDNAIHNIIWLGLDGDTHHRHAINLGQRIAIAHPYIASLALNPYLFNTDNEYEYMFLVKEYVESESVNVEEKLRVVSQSSEKILEIGPDSLGNILLNISLVNVDTKPKMMVVYYSNEQGYTIKHFDLPLTKFGGGDGTEANPYLLSTPGDFMVMSNYPAANYVVANDIDFEDYLWNGNNCIFTGTLKGNGYTLSNLNIDGVGLFSSVGGKAVISDIIIENSHLYSTRGGGFIAGSIMGENETKTPLISNVRVYNSIVSGSNGCFGAIVGTATVFSKVSDCCVRFVDFEIDGNDEVAAGGIVGRTQTSAAINNCFFEGNIEANIAGGIAGEAYTNDAFITNCHVNANIDGAYIAGGIIGYCTRLNISQCFVEGNVTATGSNKAYAGGIAGYLEPVYETEKKDIVIISNNIVGAKVAAYPGAGKSIAHRIVGFSGADNMLVDWDNVTPDMGPADYPMIPDTPDKGLDNNYGIVPIVDSSVADDVKSTEGKTIAFADLTDEFLAAADWKLGGSAAEPWVKGDNRFTLYFEDKDNVTGIDGVGSDKVSAISFDGSQLTANGIITVYNVAGLAVAQGADSLPVANLAKGVYVAKCSGSALKFFVK